MEQENPIASVVMAAYKTDQVFFRKAVESVLGQSLGCFEFIIVDDGLSAENRAYLASLEDERLRVLVNESNVGQSASVNRGVAAAHGKYVARMDSDDIALPHRLETQVAYMDAHPRCVACGGYAVRTDNHAIIPSSFPDLRSRRMGLFFACDMVHPTMMVRRSAFTERGISYDEEQIYAQDYMIWTDLLNVGEIGIVDDVVLRYRVHGGQITSSKRGAQDRYAMRAQRKLFRDRGFNVESIDFRLHLRFVKYDVAAPLSSILAHLNGLLRLARNCLPQDDFRAFRRELGFRAVKAGAREIVNRGSLLNGVFLLAFYGLRPCNWSYYAARSRQAKPGRIQVGKEATA